MSQYDPHYDPYAPREPEPQVGYSPIKHPLTFRDLLRKLATPFIALGLLFWKLKFLFAAIFKFKLLTVAGSMLVSIGAYALFWGWQFAIGFVLLILVHELGHVLEAKRQGLPVSAPMFIPFLGALITLKQLPDNVWAEAKVAIAGPILGALGAAVVWGIGEAIDSELLDRARLHGLLPQPLQPRAADAARRRPHRRCDSPGTVGRRARAARRPGDRRAQPDPDPDPVVGGLEAWRRWQHRLDPAGEAYYKVTPTQRWVTGIAYLVLAALLTLGMSATFVERDF